MFYVYDKEGKKIKVDHAVDYRTALQTGNYTKLPPGELEPTPATTLIPEGEQVEGIVASGGEESPKTGKKTKRQQKITR